MYKNEYQSILKSLIKANNEKDFKYFIDKNNRHNLKRLMGYWSELNTNSDKDIYIKAIKRLKHILKMSRNMDSWNIFLQEK